MSEVRIEFRSGDVRQTDGTQSSRYGYTGRELDAETGLQYNRARYYDAAIGRFITRQSPPPSIASACCLPC